MLSVNHHDTATSFHQPLARKYGTKLRRNLHALILILLCFHPLTYLLWPGSRTETLPINAETILAHCRALDLTPGPPDGLYTREESDRFVSGTRPTLIYNATIWTGRHDGKEVIQGDIIVDKGLIKQLGAVDSSGYADIELFDAAGAWVSPGLVDLHSHLGVYPSPVLSGAIDTNSYKGITQPWLRSLDGLNTHDDAYRLSVSGGVTTANVLPGSGTAISGQAFAIKLRPTKERSSSAILLEPPFSINDTHVDPFSRPRWRQMKHACSRACTKTRMNTHWAFRQAYDTARTIKRKQDAYCAKALTGQWAGLGDFPEDLQWEALVDVLRGRVKVQNHCFAAVDIDAMVRLTNEFKFSIAAFHHADEAYLVPDLIKKAYGEPPAVALFATTARYWREAYRGSEFAPRILADTGLDVVMKSDHPVLDSRHLVFEAQQAHYFGLAENLALASVTSTPARVMGQDHRIGRLIEGYDADIIIWDSHPLALGAAPTQVFIDGIAQISEPFVSPKPPPAQHAPVTPNWDQETQNTINHEGLPPLEPTRAEASVVVFENVGSMFVKDRQGRNVVEVFSATNTGEDRGVVVVDEGEIICSGVRASCLGVLPPAGVLYIDLEGGSISPGLLTYGSFLGLSHIFDERSTNDGPVSDVFEGVPSVVDGTVIKAADGLLFASRDAFIAYRNGVTSAVAAPGAFVSGLSTALVFGLSTVFRTAAAHKLVAGAVVQEVAALHVQLSLNFGVSVSTQIAALRGLLVGAGERKDDVVRRFRDVLEGKIPLVVAAENADIIASVLALKEEVEGLNGNAIRLVLAGATEAHMLAKEIGEAGVGVIVQQRPFPSTWQERRILAGPPLSQSSAIAALVAHNVTVGMAAGVLPATVRNTRFDAAWAGLESNGALNRADVIALASTNLETLLGVEVPDTDLVAIKGGTDFEGRVVAVISPRFTGVDLM
ncbi:carbohydrate esterase family 9 protein [Mycena filopes]|nr:carbohydrate esterase family 9 protein [Mycena filopes]